MKLINTSLCFTIWIWFTSYAIAGQEAQGAGANRMNAIAAVHADSSRENAADTMSSSADSVSSTLQSRLQRRGTPMSQIVTIPILSIDPHPDTVHLHNGRQFKAAHLPVFNFRDAIGLQVEALEYWPNADRGWILGLTDESIGGPDISVLGAAPYQSGYLLNGHLFDDPGLGVLTTTVSPVAISNGKFYPLNWSARRGFASASRTDAYSVVPYTSRLHGGIETLTDNTIGTDFDQNYYRGWLEGGIPGLERGFFTAAFERRWLGDRRPAPNASEVTPDGSSRLPGNSLDGWSGHGRFNYDFNSRVRFTAVGDYTIDEWQEYRHSWLLNAAHTPRYEDKVFAMGARLEVIQDSRHRTGYWIELGLGGNERFRGDGVVFKDYAAHNRPYVNPSTEFYDLFNAFDEDLSIIADSFVVQDGQIVGGFSRDIFFTVDEATTFNVDTLSSPGDTAVTATFDHVPSYYGDYLHRKTTYLSASAGAQYQLNKHNTFTFGIEGRRYTVRSFRNLYATRGYGQTRVNAYGFDINGNEYDGDDFRHVAKHPIIAAGFLEDRITFGRLRIDAGIRVNLFDWDGPSIWNPRSPMDPDESLQDGDNTNDDPNDTVIDEDDLKDAKEHIRFSPRLLATLQVLPNTQLRGSFGIHHQAPPFDILYVDWEFLQARIDAGSFFPFPSGTIDPERTDKWQLGIAHDICSSISASFDFFWSETKNRVHLFHQSPAFPTTWDYFANVEVQKRRGLIGSLDFHPTPELKGQIEYTLFERHGEFNYSSLLPFGWQNPQSYTDRPWYSFHKLVATAVIDLGEDRGPVLGSVHPIENTNLVILFRQWSGIRYSRATSSNEIFIGNPLFYPGGPSDGEETETLWTIDLRFERTFKVARDYKLSAIVQIHNLTDNENVTSVWLASGEPNTTGYLETPQGQVWLGTPGEELYRLKENDPMNYAPPRQVFVGLGVRF